MSLSYEWIFSGVGVTAVLFVLKMLRPPRVKQPDNSAEISLGTGAQVSGNIAGRDVQQHVHHHYAAAPVATPSEAQPIVPPSQPERSYSAHPSVEEIIDTLSAAPPYQRVQLGKSYSGSCIEWRVNFDTIQNLPMPLYGREFPQTLITHKTVKGEFLNTHLGVSVLVDIDRFPRLRTLHEGAELMVRGSIVSILDGVVPLVEAHELLFDNPLS